MGAQMGKGPGNAGIYNPTAKGKQTKNGWLKAVQADLNKRFGKKKKAGKKVGR
jgi:hypothetical protein